MTNTGSKDFIVELGTEELPPKALKNLAQSFCAEMETGLNQKNLAFSASQWFATPRRLAVKIDGLIENAPDEDVEVHGPPIEAAKDNEGNWTKAAIGFAKKNGVTPDDLFEVNSAKGKRLAFKDIVSGATAQEALPSIVEQALANLPIPKRMRWGSNRDEFVRPVHWLLMLYGSDIIPAKILGAESNNLTRGHRFHCNTDLEVANPDVYEDLLEQSGHVIADFDKRRRIIREQVEAAGKTTGGKAIIDDELLDEVTALVEWPVALQGSFEERFLEVPQEALIASMKEHQKYFHVTDANGNLLPHFITVANINSTDPAQVVSGNERVIRPRLSDAAFFNETDKKTSLESRLDTLKDIVFQEKLGSLYDKTKRIESLARFIGEQLNANGFENNPDLAARAALLSKTDLVSDMVLEFDNMQGIAGRYYALNDGEAEEVALAVSDQYLPRFSGDELPAGLTSCAVGVADRIDTLVGIFGIGQPPTGSKDPFALRRASLSVLRILVEKQLPLDLAQLLQRALASFTGLSRHDTVVQDVLDYMIERFRAWYEEDGIPVQVIQAVQAKDISVPLDFDRRVKAVHAFYQLPEAESLAAANKRVSNILIKHEGEIPDAFNKQWLTEPPEIALAKALTENQQAVEPMFAENNYSEGLTRLASLRDPIDHFFDNVMVMVEDDKIRDNRLALLRELRNLFLQVADIGLLASASKDP